MKKQLIFLVLLTTLFTSTFFVYAQEKPDDPYVNRIISTDEAIRMEQYIDSLVAPIDVVYSFTTVGGDNVDCVDIHSQPALKRPEMKGHVVQLEPQNPPLDIVKWGLESRSTDKELEAEQGFMLSGETCPDGTVPIQRLTMDIMKNFRTLEDFRKKIPSHIEPPHDGPTSPHQYAHTSQSVANWGAESVLNLWRPYTERSNEFSLSQIWVVRGSGSNRETVEAGWQKYKDLYGDWNSRLFIYFTPDNYGSGGCYNLTCSAFVQVNNSVYIGGAFNNYSSVGGNQYKITLLWYKDGTNGHWWLRYGNTWVGYYPRTLFDSNGLRNQASRIDFGGEIIDQQPGGRHTRTDMGSGYFPSEGFGYAAYQRSLRYVDTNNYYREASGLTASRTDSYCYDISLGYSSNSWKRYFFFGGSGYNSLCQ